MLNQPEFTKKLLSRLGNEPQYGSEIKFKAILTDESQHTAAASGQPKFFTFDEMKAHFESSETAAVLLFGSSDPNHGLVDFDSPIFIARTADGVTFYSANYPPESPRDVLMSGETLALTICESTSEYYS